MSDGSRGEAVRWDEDNNDDDDDDENDEDYTDDGAVDDDEEDDEGQEDVPPVRRRSSSSGEAVPGSSARQRRRSGASLGGSSEGGAVPVDDDDDDRAPLRPVSEREIAALLQQQSSIAGGAPVGASTPLKTTRHRISASAVPVPVALPVPVPGGSNNISVNNNSIAARTLVPRSNVETGHGTTTTAAAAAAATTTAQPRGPPVQAAALLRRESAAEAAAQIIRQAANSADSAARHATSQRAQSRAQWQRPLLPAVPPRPGEGFPSLGTVGPIGVATGTAPSTTGGTTTFGINTVGTEGVRFAAAAPVPALPAFTGAQRAAIRSQLLAHVQLVVQVVTLLAARGAEGDAARVRALCGLLEELHKCWVVTSDYKKVLAFCINGGAPAPGAAESLFHFATIRFVPPFVALFRRSTPPTREQVRQAVDPLAPGFDARLACRSTAPRGLWSPAEDRLLLAGLETYDRDWRTIQAQLLPTKSVAQIIAHFKNRSSRKADDNPIKQLKLEAPLTVREQQAVLQGVHTYGPNWELIREHFLPYRKCNVIRRFYMRWKKMFFSRQMFADPALLAAATAAAGAGTSTSAVSAPSTTGTQNPAPALLLHHEEQPTHAAAPVPPTAPQVPVEHAEQPGTDAETMAAAALLLLPQSTQTPRPPVQDSAPAPQDAAPQVEYEELPSSEEDDDDEEEETSDDTEHEEF